MISSFITELKRRNVLRVGAAYLVVGWLILQFIDVVFPMFGLDEALGRPILVVLLVGLPIVLIFAWVFELTPEGIRKEKDIDRSSHGAEPTGHLLDRAIIVVLIFAIGLLLVDKFVLQPKPVQQEQLTGTRGLNSVAVLPFLNLSGKKENEYFSDGLTETLLHLLSQIPDLKVAARTSSFAFKGKDADVREIAASLGVATVLEGSVQRAGNTVRITAQLIEAETGFHLWSKTFDRDLDDIFSVQDEIASSVVGALRVTLLADVAANQSAVVSLGTKDAQAYEKFLLALEQKNIASYGSLPKAEGMFKEALSIDPDFNEAKVELAYVYGLQAETGILTATAAAAKVRALLDQVLRANAKDGRALGLLAGLDWQNAVQSYGPVSKQASTAEDFLRQAIELAPNDPEIYFVLSIVAASANRNDEALQWIDEGLDRDPLSARLHLQRGRLLLGVLERPEEAEAAFAKGREIAPEWTAVNFASGDAAFLQNHFADGISWYLRAMSLDPQDHELPANISRFYYRLGLEEEGDEMLRRAQAIAPQEPWTRGLELEKQLHADNHERVVILAESIIRDNIENRGGAFNLAVVGFVGSMIELGKAESVIDFFESLKPGISTAAYVPTGFKEAFIQLILVQALVHVDSFEAANAILDSLIAFGDNALPNWRDNDYVMATISVVRGDREAAIEYALRDLDQPLGKNLNWSLNYQHMAWIKPLLRDERLAKRITELKAETQAAGDEVRTMLAQRRAEQG